MNKILEITFVIICLSSISTFAQNTSTKDVPKPKILTVDVCNGKAIYLLKPDYPQADASLSGAVNVVIRTDAEGNVIFAQGVSGHPLLRQQAEKAALKAKLKQIILEGKLVGITCILFYNFGKPERVEVKNPEKEVPAKDTYKNSFLIQKRISLICERKN